MHIKSDKVTRVTVKQRKKAIMNMSFNYVIKNAAGKYYKGYFFGDGRDWTSEKREGFGGACHYTEQGAHLKLLTAAYFQGCTVERV